MAGIRIKCDSELGFTYVPNTFIDEYMTQADGEFVKIYLYLLRCMGDANASFSIPDTADLFDNTERDVKRALKYWEKKHLLRLEFDEQDELASICLLDLTASAANAVVSPASCPDTKNVCTPASTGGADAAEPLANADMEAAFIKAAASREASVNDRHDTAIREAGQALDLTAGPAPCASKAAASLPERTEYTRDQLYQFAQDDCVRELFFVAEQYTGHPLSNPDTQTILYWLDKLHFSQDMIEYLIEQCVSKNHKSIRYMDKIALSWADQGIQTLDQAKEADSAQSNTVHAVMKAFGISGRSLVAFERDYVEKWSSSMGFDDEIIACACQRTIRSAHQISFEYADSILSSWKKQNVCSIKDIALLDAQYQEARKASFEKVPAAHTARGTTRAGRFGNFEQRSYDYDALEKELLTR